MCKVCEEEAKRIKADPKSWINRLIQVSKPVKEANNANSSK